MAQDEALGPVLLSVKHELLAGQDYVRLILRLQTGTLHEVVPASCLSDQATPHRMAKVSLSFPLPDDGNFAFPFVVISVYAVAIASRQLAWHASAFLFRFPARLLRTEPADGLAINVA